MNSYSLNDHNIQSNQKAEVSNSKHSHSRLPSSGIDRINDCLDHLVHEEPNNLSGQPDCQELNVFILDDNLIQEKENSLNDAEGLSPDIYCV